MQSTRCGLKNVRGTGKIPRVMTKCKLTLIKINVSSNEKWEVTIDYDL